MRNSLRVCLVVCFAVGCADVDTTVTTKPTEGPASLLANSVVFEQTRRDGVHAPLNPSSIPVTFVPGFGVERMASPLVADAAHKFGIVQEQVLAVVSSAGREYRFEFSTPAAYRELYAVASDGQRIAVAVGECAESATWNEGKFVCAEHSVFLGQLGEGVLTRVPISVSGQPTAVALTEQGVVVAATKFDDKSLANGAGLLSSDLELTFWDGSGVQQSVLPEVQTAAGNPCSTRDGRIFAIQNVGNGVALVTAKVQQGEEWAPVGAPISLGGRLDCGLATAAYFNPVVPSLQVWNSSTASFDDLTSLVAKDVGPWSTFDIDPITDEMYFTTNPGGESSAPAGLIGLKDRTLRQMGSDGGQVGPTLLDGSAWSYTADEQLRIEKRVGG
jgi:hypothetical protein